MNPSPNRSQLFWTVCVGIGLLVSAWLQTSSIGVASRELPGNQNAKFAITQSKRGIAASVRESARPTTESTAELIHSNHSNF